MSSKHLEGVSRVLSPEAFEDFKRRLSGTALEIREKQAEYYRDTYPPGYEHIAPDGMATEPWYLNWVRERGGITMEEYDKLIYEEFVEWAYRVIHAIGICKRAVAEKPPVSELIKAKWLCHLSHPPAYMVRPDLGFSTTQMLYGKYATTMWCHVDWWRGEFVWFQGYHNEDGVPVQHWIIGMTKEIVQHFDEEDRQKLLTPSDFMAVPPDVTAPLDRRHLRTGIKLREIPKRSPYDLVEWLRMARDIIKDLREEIFPRWTHATLYISTSPGNMGIASQHAFWTAQFWALVWMAMNATRLIGIPIMFYTYEPLPPILNTLLALPAELWVRRLEELFTTGPKGLVCDAINKVITPEKKTPMLHQMRELYLKGKAFKGLAIPYDEGIPPPKAFFTALPAPVYREVNIRDIFANPDKLPKEYWELLESEGGVDRKTGRIPPYNEVPRIKWLFDPTIEWLKPSDFPPIDWKEGQVWPVDMTREKLQIMVEEGYDGSGENILHYSCLADRKMGQEGKLVLLGTTPYKLPVE